MEKQYIGDGVYVMFNGHQFILTTENGFEVTNIIILDLDVYSSLTAYVRNISERMSKD